MDKIKKERTVCRMIFTKAKSNFDAKLSNLESQQKTDLIAAYKFLQSKAESLFAVDERVKELWLDDPDFDVDRYVEDAESMDKYCLEWETMKARYDEVMLKTAKEDDEISDCSDLPSTVMKTPEKGKGRAKKGCSSKCESCNSPKKSNRLPKIELRKFDGNLKEWLGFWGQFKKIDSDVCIDDDDKFHYLYQSTVPGSPARDLIDSFPPSGANYKKAIEQLKARFARDDLLVEIYVRELLNLVLAQTKQSISYTLSQLYDKLKTQLQALETLGVTTDKYAAMLFPLVESALPEDTLRAWQRSKTQPTNDNLENLLEFVKTEVESEERIKLARSGLQADEVESEANTPTAACLSTTDKEAKKGDICVWCDKSGHNSFECYKGNKMGYEKRKELLTKKRICFNCLRPGHPTKSCRNKNRCIACSKRHNVWLCPNFVKPKQNSTDDEEPKAQANASQKVGNTTLLQTMIINISSGNNVANVRAFIDTGAQKSYIRSDVAKRLKMKPVRQESLGHCLFGGVITSKKIHDVYEFTVSSLDGENKLQMSALAKDTICGSIPRLHNTHKLKIQLDAKQIVLSDCGSGTPEVDLLIGADYIGALLTSTLMPLDDNVIAIKTKLGWTLQGRVDEVNVSASSFTLANNIQLSDMWDLESIGIKDPAGVTSQADEERNAMENFLATVQINKEGRYEVDLPWKATSVALLSNKDMAEKRLMSTTNKLLKLNEWDAYDNVFQEWLSLGIIEEVNQGDKQSISGHYMPHHAVIKESSLTTRVRPVFDASAVDKNGNSLNARLDKGLNLLELILKLIIRFRMRAIGISSDIKKAFLQISVNPKDREFLKFLWWKNRDMKEITEYRHWRVVFGLTCSPFLLAATIIHHLSKYKGNLKDSADRLKAAFYVDNCVTSLETEKQAKNFIEEAKSIMSEAKFELRGWITAPVKYHEMTGSEQSMSVLGLKWLIKEDKLSCFCNLTEEQHEKITKRTLLSVAQKIFDPVGFTCPTTLIPKLILQKVWQRESPFQRDRESSWDTTLPSDLCEEFKSWKKHTHLLSECVIPRRLTEHAIDNCKNTLHVFCDASQASYAACIFLRSEINEDVSVQLVLSKSRVAPSRKEISMPRLELLAALIATRLYLQVKEALDVDYKTTFWTDSSIVLTWITTQGDWKVFVKNRVEEIRKNSNVEDWRHIAGHLNPADLPSRGCNAKLLQESKWWEGPTWLKANPNDWPHSSVDFNPEEVEKERKKTVTVVTNLSDSNHDSFISRLTYFNRFSKIVRLIAWILRFIRNCKQDKMKGEITCDEYQLAEKTLMKLIQRECSVDEKIKMKNKYVFKDNEGIVRLHTKLLLSGEPASFTNPIFLQGNHIILRRLVEEAHRHLKHAGSGVMIAFIRENYWITGIRKMVKSVISQCNICKRINAKPLQTPLPPLPADRVKPGAVFEVSGVDLAGPLFLRGGGKVWIVLFTCAVYRAIHLELTRSLSTNTFLMALRRFIARRGRERELYSDNGTNFVGANNMMNAIDWNQITLFSNANKITWKFSPPSAPWWGGWWERLIRSVKDLLKKNLGRASVTYEELETLLCDCEAVINSRPLTFIVDDTENLKPLTPACFMQSLYSSEVPDLDRIDHVNLNKRFQYLQKLRDGLRSRFRVEYLGLLVQRGKETKNFCKLHEGDVVLIKTSDKRVNWPLGMIMKLYEGRDGNARVADVKTCTGVYTRAVQNLYLMEVSRDGFPRPGGC